MERLNIFIIGNRLHTFANNRNIFTYNQFSWLWTIESKLHQSLNTYSIHIGQGLNDQQILEIQKKIQNPCISGRFSLTGYLSRVHRAANALTHKIQSRNSMISDPERFSDSFFKSYLLLDESCAEMSDHITGQHIQGMVLIEACRQMINSVSEKYLIPLGNSSRKGFVLNALNTNFLEYVFPLEVELLFNLESVRHGLGGNFKAKAIIEIRQNDQISMKAEATFSVMDKSTLINIESQMAQTAVEEALLSKPLHIIHLQNIA